MTPENSVKTAIIELLTYAGALVIRVNSGAVTGEYKGKRRFVKFTQWQASGTGEQSSGVADILAIYQGVPLAIECKAPGRARNVSQSQRFFLDEWRQHGGIAIVASDSYDVLKVLERVRKQ